MRPTALNKFRGMNNYREQLIRMAKNADPKLANDLQNLKIDWYTIRNAAEDDSLAEVMIYDEIGFWGITADDFIRDLSNVKAKTINVRINSPGGEVYDAIAIYNALVSHSATVNVQVDSLAASAASVIAMAGDTVTMMRGAQMMIHDVIGITWGNAGEFREYAKWLDQQSDNIASIYAARTPKVSTEEWRAKMLAETWLFADEAVELGLADSVYQPKQEDMPVPEKEDPEEGDPEQESESGDDEEVMPEDKMQQEHNLNNRGWKYAGRNKAPAGGLDIDALMASLDRVFGGK